MFQLLTSVLDLLNVIFTTFFTLELLLKIGAFGIRVRNLLLCNLFYPGIFPWSLEFFWFPYCDWVSCGYLHESTSGELAIVRIGFFPSNIHPSSRETWYRFPSSASSVSFEWSNCSPRETESELCFTPLSSPSKPCPGSPPSLPSSSSYMEWLVCRWETFLFAQRLTFFLFRFLGKFYHERAPWYTGTTISRHSLRWLHTTIRSNEMILFQVLLLLFRSATGEGWQEIMLACSATPVIHCLVVNLFHSLPRQLSVIQTRTKEMLQAVDQTSPTSFSPVSSSSVAFLSSTSLLPSSWITLTISYKTARFWVLIIWSVFFYPNEKCQTINRVTLWERGGSLTLLARENSHSLSCFHCSGFLGRRGNLINKFQAYPPSIGLGSLMSNSPCLSSSPFPQHPNPGTLPTILWQKPNYGDPNISVVIFIGGWISWVQTDPLCHHQNKTKDHDRRFFSRRRSGTEKGSENNLEDFRGWTWSSSTPTKGRTYHD